jgi:glycosyltransferase involved in cell wall biosynthesis
MDITDMRVGIDGRMIEDKMHGIARYTLNLLKGILNIDRENQYTLLITNKFPYRDEMRFDNLRYVYMKAPFVSLYEPIELRRILGEERFDLFHSPSFIPPFYASRPFLMTIHDLTHLTYPDFRYRFYYKFIITPYIKRAKRIITVSEFSKSEICRAFRLRQENVIVIYNGVEDRFMQVGDERDIPKVRERYGLPDKFILSIGNEKGHKNLKGLLSALKFINKDYSLVLNLNPGGTIERQAREFGVRERVHFIGYIEDMDMPFLYNAAEVFVLVSLNEGFALPALEAMACGCPAVVSNTASLPEVCRDAAYYVDPYSANNIAEGINKVLFDLELRNSLIQKGLERAKQFNWEKASRKMLVLYRREIGRS